jgi:hypothetical protein
MTKEKALKKTFAAAIIGAALTLLPVSIAWGATTTTETCTTHRVAVTRTVRVTIHPIVHGHRTTKVVKKKEVVRHNVRVRIAYKVKVKGKTVTRHRTVVRSEIEYRTVKSCTPTATLTGVTTTTTQASGSATANTVAAATKTSVQALIDPDATVAVTTPQAPPVPVLFNYSASVASGNIPDGELTLTISLHNSVSATAVCQANVSGATSSTALASCTKSIPSWGEYDLVTNYSSGISNVATTGQTDTIDIQPPALADASVNDSWPTDTPSIAATVDRPETSADVTLTDGNFEGATGVTLTDQLGDECGATVSGTTAECTMSIVGIPSSFTVGYLGGATTVANQSAAPWGTPEQQKVTTNWPADTYQASSPAVTTPTTTNDSTTYSISQINAFPKFISGSAPTPCNPGNFQCAAFGVSGLPAHGTVTMTVMSDGTTDAAVGETCTIDLTSATACFVQDSMTNSDLTSWTVKASWSGYSSGTYNVTNFSAANQTFNMQVTAGGASTPPLTTSPTGAWWSYNGNSGT